MYRYPTQAFLRWLVLSFFGIGSVSAQVPPDMISGIECALQVTNTSDGKKALHAMLSFTPHVPLEQLRFYEMREGRRAGHE